MIVRYSKSAVAPSALAKTAVAKTALARFARSRSVAAAATLSLTLSCAGPAWAALGGDAASVRADVDALRGVVHSTALQRYDIQEITTDSGMRVREFLDGNGLVFAVAWNGPAVPDLQRLLGTANFATYTKALADSKLAGGRASLGIALPELVVESGGHQRAYVGRAYVPALVPAGTAAADLR
ncbi:MAG: DUF2844 domain-containing protein [Pseudomonadota bacterium]|nr:DUF2844 domain-containing protein [Pseudomonadota bacterium]